MMLTFFRRLLVVVILGATITSCSRELDEPEAFVDERRVIDTLLRDAVNENPAIRSALFGVRSESGNFEYHAAFGQARAGDTAEITPESQFMVASVTKTMVAARTLQLVEDGLLALDDNLADLGVLPNDVVAQLHAIDGTSYGRQITIRHLLNHTSGLRDYLLDDRAQTGNEVDAGVAPGSLAGVWLSHLEAFLTTGVHPNCADSINCDETLYPARQWNQWDAAAFEQDSNNRDAGLLNFYLSEMADKALFPPGEGAHYSDTNYLLLGLTIESLTGMTLDSQLRTGIFDPLGMHDTYLSYTPPHPHPTPRVSDWYAQGVPMVSASADTSWDWGGGGVVTTTRDLLTFISALMAGQLFEKPETLDKMLDPIRLAEKEGRLVHGYGLGISFRETALGPRWGHSGAWGAQMFYFPDHQVSVGGTVNDYGSGHISEELAMSIATLVAQ